MNWNSVAGWSLILAPVAQLGGWTLMRLGGNDGAEPQNTIAHTVWLIGFVMLAFVCVELYRRVRARGAARLLARASLTVAMVSVAASVAEMIADLYVAFATDTRAEVEALWAKITSVPMVEQILFGFGTQLVYLGFLVLVVQLAVLRRIGASTLVLVLATLVLFIAYEVLDGNGFGRQALMPLAVSCMWLALAPLGWRMLRPTPGATPRSGSRETMSSSTAT